MRVIVTGGCGFIGSHVVDALIARGDRVAVVDSREEPAVSWDRVLGQVGENSLVLGDCSQPWRLFAAREVLRDVDVVLHLAAQSHVCRSLESPRETFRLNGEGTLVVADWCAKEGIPLVYVSTDEVYGDLAGTRWRETGAVEGVTPVNPSSPYSAGKASGEMAVRAAARSFGLRAVITRGSNAWGPRQYGEKLLPIAIRLLRRGLPVPLHGGGVAVRQWIAVEEFAEGVIRAARWLLDYQPDEVHVFNLAGPTSCRVLDVVATLATALRASGVDVAHPAGVSAADRPGQDLVYHVDGTAARRAFDGFSPSRSILDPVEIAGLLAVYPGDGEVVLPDYVGPGFSPVGGA